MKPHESAKALGGKSKATLARKFSAPVKITAPMVKSMPTQSVTVRWDMNEIRRYSNTTFNTPTAAAIIFRCVSVSSCHKYRK